MKYEVIATYTVKKILEVDVGENGNPWRPDEWESIDSEQDIDSWLYDIEDVKYPPFED